MLFIYQYIIYLDLLNFICGYAYYLYHSYCDFQSNYIFLEDYFFIKSENIGLLHPQSSSVSTYFNASDNPFKFFAIFKNTNFMYLAYPILIFKLFFALIRINDRNQNCKKIKINNLVILCMIIQIIHHPLLEH